MKSHFDLKLSEHIQDADKKAKYTKSLFSEVSASYHHILSFGSLYQDKKWKKLMLEWIKIYSTSELKFICDLATGSGEIAALFARSYPKATVKAIDITPKMLEMAKLRYQQLKIDFIEADIGKIELKKNHFDLITGGYALRNSPNLKKFISDCYDWLKPEGLAIFLDFSRTDNPLLFKLKQIPLTIWCQLISWLLHRNNKIYHYIPASLEHFPSRKNLHQMFIKQGFQIVQKKVFLFGIIELILLKKPLGISKK